MSALEELRKKSQELQEDYVKFPLTKMVIDHSEGKWRLGGTYNPETYEYEGAEYLDKPEVVILGRYGEYSVFDPDSQRFTLKSTIEEPGAGTVFRNVRTGEELDIDALKEAGIGLKYQGHYIGLLLKDGEAIPVDVIVRGTGLMPFINLFKDPNYNKLRAAKKVKLYPLNKQKKGSNVYYVPGIKKGDNFKLEFTDVTEKEAAQIIKQLDDVVNSFEEYRKAYNTRFKNEWKESESLENETVSVDVEAEGF